MDCRVFGAVLLYGMSAFSAVDAATYSVELSVGDQFVAASNEAGLTRDVTSSFNSNPAIPHRATGVSEPGRLALSGRATSATIGGSSFSSSGSSLIMSATFLDTLFFSVDEGHLNLSLDLLGAFDLVASNPLQKGILDGSATLFADGSFVYGVPFGGGALDSVSSGLIDVKNILNIPFSGGQLTLSGSLVARGGCGSNAGEDGICSVALDLGNSLRFVGATVSNSEGEIVSLGFQSSSSGFDYVAGIAPHSRAPVAPVPIGNTLFLLMTGIAFLGKFRIVPGRASPQLHHIFTSHA